MTTASSTPGPLTDKRVVEIGLFHAGPTCAAMLAALGAEVIKVEDPKRGDPARGLVSLYGQDCQLAEDRTIPFETYNAGKKSLTINLSHRRGLQLFYAIVAKADVLIHNVRAETAAAMRIDYDSLLRHNAGWSVPVSPVSVLTDPGQPPGTRPGWLGPFRPDERPQRRQPQAPGSATDGNGGSYGWNSGRLWRAGHARRARDDLASRSVSRVHYWAAHYGSDS